MQNVNDHRIKSVALEYKKNQKLIKATLVAIACILVLILIFILVASNMVNFNNKLNTIQTSFSDDFVYPYIGENGNWFLNGEDTGISAIGEDGAVPVIGENGNWYVNGNDTGISAGAGDNAAGVSLPYVGQNGNWWINGKDTGVSAQGTQGAAGADGKDGAQGPAGETPYIGADGNWWIGDTNTGVPAKPDYSGSNPGQGGGNPDGTAPPSTEGNNGFTVKIDPQQGEKSLAISESRGFSNPVQRLETHGVDNSWNITFADIPNTVDSDVGGSKNGQNYFVYTFFLKNTGDLTTNYNEMLTLMDNRYDAVKALRFMMYRDGQRVRYASPAADGSKEPFACDESFTGDVNLIDKVQTNLLPGQIVRYTVVVWFEGNDPECVNDILGGAVRLSLGFKVA